MDIKDFLSPADVMIDIRSSDKDQLLKELSQRAAAATGLDAERASDAILKREGLGSTGMGDGVAIPHARIQSLNKPFGILARLKKAIDFAAIDEKPVDLVFLLLLPGAAEGDQLNVLASVARRLRDPGITAGVRRARDSAEMYQAFIAG